MTNGKKILVIDNDENITRTFARILIKNGYQADTANTAEEAMQKVKNSEYAVVLTDNCFPDMNGTQFLDLLINQAGKMVKIIIAGFPDMAPDEDDKVDAYLMKPVKPQDLLSVIAQKITEK